ncbi:acylneuraminate cytidylyltransferase family protein [Brevundimonas kwangchunensis]|uniref:Acylneuraminate cytidylyltransferase family protein n=1 Tax=Brevundimonas kwangchunensis TaxID=322163 RepID=A0ABP3RIX1_9CAUL
MLGDRRVIAVITARGGSKGLPGKNLIPFRGRPLIAWTIAAAQASAHIDTLILSSDDADIISAARSFGCEAPFVRDAVLSTDEATSMSVLLDAIERSPDHDIAVLLQPTSPLRATSDIDGALMLLHQAPAVVSVTAAEVHPWLTYHADEDGKLSAFVEPPAGASLRRQDLPSAWSLNGAVYAAEIEWLKRERTFLQPGQTAAWIMPAGRSADIDTLADLKAAEVI